MSIDSSAPIPTLTVPKVLKMVDQLLASLTESNVEEIKLFLNIYLSTLEMLESKACKRDEDP